MSGPSTRPIAVRPLCAAEHARWDAFVMACPKGTLLHTQRFLGYHGARFADRSLILERGERWVGVLPAVLHPDRPTTVVSHFGATFGGLLVKRLAAAELTYELLQAAAAHYRKSGVEELVFRLPPAHLAAQPDEAALHALFRLGARIDRMDLWSVIQLDRPRRRKDVASARQGKRLGVTVELAERAEDYSAYHELLVASLARRHGATPVHSCEALLQLRQRLGEDQALWLARQPDGTLGAGLWLLRHREGVFHTQYIAGAESARKTRSLDVLTDHLVADLQARGARILSFGASTEDGGRHLNANLHQFKSKFGGGALTQAHARWRL